MSLSVNANSSRVDLGPQRVEAPANIPDPRVIAIHNRAIDFPAIPNERSRKVMDLTEKGGIAFPDGLTELIELIDSKDYDEAHNISNQLIELYLKYELTAAQSNKLFTLFNKLVKSGKETLGTPFYAFLKSVLASRLREQERHDPEQVIAAYKEASKLGNFNAMFYLGTYYASLERFNEAFQQYLSCALAFPNNPEPLKEIAIYYQEGLDNVPPNPQVAEEHYRRAVALGCKDSACSLACMLEKQPVGTDEQRQEVIDLYTFAKERGVSDAAFNLGVINQTGWKRTTEDGEKLCDESLINFNEAEANFRLAYTLEINDVNAIAVAEIIFDNKPKLTEARWKEMKELIQRTKDNGSFESLELEKKIEESGAPRFPSPQHMMDALLQFCDGQLTEPVLENSALMQLAQKSIFIADQEVAQREEAIQKAPVREIAERGLPIPAKDAEVEKLTKKLMKNPDSIALLHKLALAQLKANRK